jgi:hypothetical protein
VPKFGPQINEIKEDIYIMNKAAKEIESKGITSLS